jgi:phage terminase large subunit-like protein
MHRKLVNPFDYAFFSFRPRPDQPKKYDEQTSFMNSEHPGVTFLLGGTGAGTTSCGLAKAVRFMMKTPPPRKDTPFWILSESFEDTISTCWKEKLHQQGHLPPNCVEWERINWYKPNLDLPFSVPIKSWGYNPDGTPKNKVCPNGNWTVTFKSYEQGRQKLQGQSIGGFLFVEQFPFGLLEEVLGRCREYSFTGNKLAEFTPIDPERSVKLQEMEENNELPDGWAIYRANTEVALECGHVSKQWFDQFFGMLSPQMRRIRTKGLWGAYEGAVYPEFDAKIHCVRGNYPMPVACHHRRSFDWGSGAQNAFCCLFMCKTGHGLWYIYDEYYSTEPLSTVEHLKRVSDQHHWPKHNPYYGNAWGDPSGLDRFRIAAQLDELAPGYDAIAVQSANNSVEEGIEHIRWMLEPTEAMSGVDGEPKPRLIINQDNCPNLVREMRTYRRYRPVSTSVNAVAAKDAPLKIGDHAVDALRYCCWSEACTSGMIPRTIARQHSANRHGIQLQSSKFDRK